MAGIVAEACSAQQREASGFMEGEYGFARKGGLWNKSPRRRNRLPEKQKAKWSPAQKQPVWLLPRRRWTALPLAFGLPLCRRQCRTRVQRRARAVSMEVDTSLAPSEVEECWAQAESMGDTEAIAASCALLCCVQRQLGYLAADHEGKNGAARLVSQVPALPLALSWEGKDHIFGMSIAVSGDCNLLDHLQLGSSGQSKTGALGSQPLAK
ncbi:unnamed protein product [Effrenium voratum]|nr:unnamed protein product [Effrenium voratum]